MNISFLVVVGDQNIATGHISLPSDFIPEFGVLGRWKLATVPWHEKYPGRFLAG
jgi:hypothetical protein